MIAELVKFVPPEIRATDVVREKRNDRPTTAGARADSSQLKSAEKRSSQIAIPKSE